MLFQDWRVIIQNRVWSVRILVRPDRLRGILKRSINREDIHAVAATIRNDIAASSRASLLAFRCASVHALTRPTRAWRQPA